MMMEHEERTSKWWMGSKVVAEDHTKKSIRVKIESDRDRWRGTRKKEKKKKKKKKKKVNCNEEIVCQSVARHSLSTKFI